MRCGFVDPRNHPAPEDPRPPARTTNDRGALVALQRLCREGRLYDVEQWIRDGRPLQAARDLAVQGRRIPSALDIGLASSNHALIVLLLCNGYDPNLEPACPVSVAIRGRQWELMEVLLAWGAYPLRVAPEDVCESYNTELLERFFTLGLDFTADHVLGNMLAEHSSNKPLFGFAKRHREHDPNIQREITMALGHHAGREGSEKGVLLCLWAGADPHSRVPSLRYPDDADDEASGSTAIEEACHAGNFRVLERFRPDPGRDDFDELYASAPTRAVVDFLARSVAPSNVGKILRRQLFWLEDRAYLTSTRSTDVLWGLFEAGGRWVTSPADELADLRRALLRLADATFVEVAQLFATADYGGPAVLHELGRTASIRTRLRHAFLPSPYDPTRRPPARWRDVLAKFEVPSPSEPAGRSGARAPDRREQREQARPTALPACVEIGFRRRRRQELRLDRAALFERVWSEPVGKLAARWGMSGRGLAKACQRLKIPVPPRGYWTKRYHGESGRRPELPLLRPGEAEEIVIHVPA